MKSPSRLKVQKESALKPLERFTSARYAPVGRFIAYQIVWWLLVYSVKLEELSGIHQLSNLLALIVSVVSLNMILNRRKNTSARRRLLALTVLGFAIDTVWINLGLIETKPVLNIAETVTIGPAWLFAIWISFAATCIASVSLESKNLFATPQKKFVSLLLLAGLGAVGGPLSYMVGGPIGVLTLQHRPTSVVALALEWAVAFPAILIAAWFVRARDPKITSKTGTEKG